MENFILIAILILIVGGAIAYLVRAKNNLLKLHPPKKNLPINLTKKMKYLYAQNYKTLIKKTEDESNK